MAMACIAALKKSDFGDRSTARPKVPGLILTRLVFRQFFLDQTPDWKLIVLGRKPRIDGISAMNCLYTASSIGETAIPAHS
jgi:hypothetical protein